MDRRVVNVRARVTGVIPLRARHPRYFQQLAHSTAVLIRPIVYLCFSAKHYLLLTCVTLSRRDVQVLAIIVTPPPRQHQRRPPLLLTSRPVRSYGALFNVTSCLPLSAAQFWRRGYVTLCRVNVTALATGATQPPRPTGVSTRLIHSLCFNARRY